MVSTTRTDASGRRCHTDRTAGHSARAFTLVELLVVIGIIVLLLGVAITVGRSVTISGRTRATEHILRTLDAALSGDIADNDGPPGLYYYDRHNGFVFPIVDGRVEGRQLPVPAPWPQAPSNQGRFDVVYDPPQPSLSLLVLQSGEDSQLARAVQSLDTRFVERQRVPAYGWRYNPNTGQLTSGTLELQMIEMTVVRDGFGHAIRAVLPGVGGGSGPYFSPDTSNMVSRDPMLVDRPKASGTGVRPTSEFVRSYRPFEPANVRAGRPVGDADEGRTIGNRPYLYSVGSDGDPGTRKDNVYVSVPSFETETRNFPTSMN